MAKSHLRSQSPKVNWERLFHDWMRSGKPKEEFLKSRQIPLEDMHCKKNTGPWESDVLKAAEAIRNAGRKDPNHPDEIVRVIELEKDPNIDLSKVASGEEPKTRRPEVKAFPRQSPNHPREAIAEIWQVIAQWRQQQSESDYKLADIIRSHCKLLLAQSLVRGTDAKGNQTVKTSLRPNELQSIASVAEKVQRIQRLALGLSTENVGVEAMRHTIEDDVPVFEVQMTDGGKFVKLRA